MNLKVLGYGVVHWIHLAQHRDALNAIINVNHGDSSSVAYQFYKLVLSLFICNLITDIFLEYSFCFRIAAHTSTFA